MNVFLIPSQDGTTLRWSIIGDNVVITSSIPNPFISGSSVLPHGYPTVGSMLSDNVIMQAAAEAGTATQPATTPAIRIVISTF